MEREKKTIIFIGIIVTVIIIINYKVIIIINYKELQFCSYVLQLHHLVEGKLQLMATRGWGDKKGEKTRGTRLHFTSGHVKWDAQHVHENKNMVTKATGFNFCCQGGNNGSYGCVVVV